MRNVLDEICGENKNIFYAQYFFLENRVLYDVMSKNMVEAEGLQMTSQYCSYALNAG